MRTYEVTMQVIRYEKVLVEVESHEEVREEAFAKTVLAIGERAEFWQAKDITPPPITDKDRMNAAFKALRKVGYPAKQGQSRELPEYPERHIMTMADDADAYRNRNLIGMIPVHWDSDNIRMAQVETIMQAFKDEGLDTQWDGKFWNCIEIRKGVEA